MVASCHITILFDFHSNDCIHLPHYRVVYLFLQHSITNRIISHNLTSLYFKEDRYIQNIFVNVLWPEQ